MVDDKTTCKHCNGTNNVTKCEVSERCDGGSFCDGCMKPCTTCNKHVCTECSATCNGCASLLICYDTCAYYCETCDNHFCHTHLTSNRGISAGKTENGNLKCGACIDANH